MLHLNMWGLDFEEYSELCGEGEFPVQGLLLCSSCLESSCVFSGLHLQHLEAVYTVYYLCKEHMFIYKTKNNRTDIVISVTFLFRDFLY